MKPLTALISTSLQSGIFPDLMKIAKVIPLHKGGEMNIPDNFRPISLLPVLSKVLERVAFDKVTSHLERNKIVYSRQYGFRKNHSTSDVDHSDYMLTAICFVILWPLFSLVNLVG